MRQIPDFLRPENIKVDSESQKMMKLIAEYEKTFEEEVTTEPASYSTKEWIMILQRCIAEKVKLGEILPGELEDGDSLEHEHIIIID